MPGLRRTAVHITGSMLDAEGSYVVCRSGSLDCAGGGRDAADPLGAWEPFGRRSGRWAAPLAAVAGVCLLGACEKPFEPIPPHDLAFSIYGHLEANVDTQWVRVTPIRTSLPTAPGPIDAAVTLEELETGTRVVMSDSLVRYLPVNFEDADVYAHNFHTTMPMVPGRNYRLTATRSDGATSSATVLIPEIEDPVAEWSFSYFSGIGIGRLQPARARIQGMRHIGILLREEDFPDECGYPISVHQEPLRIEEEGLGNGSSPHRAMLEWGVRPQWVQPRPACDHEGPVDVILYASGAPWAFGDLSRLREITHPAYVANVEGGLGFLAGVQKWIFPFEKCFPLTREGTCTIAYSARSATLHGIVTSSCGSPIPVSEVILRGSQSGTRHAQPDATGRFRYRAVDPSVPYTLTARLPGLEVSSDPLVLSDAAVDTVTVRVEDWPC